ncbi:MAG: hypothetical protein AAB074_06695 [Planctomycetota bacterium]
MKTSRPILLVALFLLVGLLTVWQQAETLRLGYRIRDREQRLAELERERRRLEAEVGRCKAPATLMDRATALGVDLVVPQDWRVLKPGQAAPLTSERVVDARNPGRP